MKRWSVAMLMVMCVVAVSGLAADSARNLRARLSGFQEVPTLSTSGNGRFEARVNRQGTAVDWRLRYSDLEGQVLQAHIHFQARALNGPIVVFLCTNLGNGPAGTQACPPSPATVEGTFTAADVLGGAAALGLEAGNLDELLAALRAGATYANVHSELRPGGEIRGQIAVEDDNDNRGHGGH